MDLFQAMQVYVKVVESGSMTAAALDCGISTTMVGNHLRSLEQRLGVSLLNRTTRRQRLTEFGTTYYQRCLEVLGLVADSERLAEQVQGEPSGTLRITAPLTFGSERLTPALSEFVLRYPRIRLDVMLSNQREPSALIARPLENYALTVCASPAYLKRRGTPLIPQDLEHHDCLAFAYPAGDDWRTVEKQWSLSGPEGEILVPVSGPMTINSSSALYQAALAGMGIVMLPDALLRDDLREGRLVPLLGDYKLPSRPMNLLYAQDRYRLPKLRSFVEFVLEKWAKP